MASAESLQRLQGLVDRLLPLAAAQSGEPVRADDWNTLVGALIDVARVAIAEAAPSESVPPHDHPDQVKLSWLDPALRDALGSGGLGSVGGTTKAGQVELDLKRLQRRFDEVGGTVSGLTDRLTAVASRDLVREADLTQLRRNVDQVSGSGADDLVQVRRQIDSVSNDVKRAVAAADRLTVNGELVDVAALSTRVGSIEKLREGLTLPTGELLSAGRLEQRFTELTNKLVTEEELDKALKTRATTFDDAQIKTITTNVATDVRKRIGGDLDTLKQELTANTDERLRGFDATVKRQIDDATPGLRAGLEQTLKDRFDAGLAETRAAILTENSRRIDETDGRLRAELSQQVEGLRANIGGVVGAALAQQLPGRLAAVDERIGAALGRLDVVEGAVDRVTSGIGSVGTRLGELTTEFRNGLNTVNTRLTSEVAGVRGEIGTVRGGIEGRIGILETRTNGQIGGVFGRLDAAEGAITRFDSSFGTVNSQLTDLTNGLGQANSRLAAEVAGVRGELTATRRDLDTKVGAVESGLNGRFEARLKETTAILDSKLDARVSEVRGGLSPVIITDRINR